LIGLLWFAIAGMAYRMPSYPKTHHQTEEMPLQEGGDRDYEGT